MQSTDQNFHIAFFKIKILLFIYFCQPKLLKVAKCHRFCAQYSVISASIVFDKIFSVSSGFILT